ncbi:hypothetical protein STTU_3117 [Streptomyces sp. Tu6071]|nr:hypothetical protein STTU_3117 [Streptomyces sp. Tu6071]
MGGAEGAGVRGRGRAYGGGRRPSASERGAEEPARRGAGG